MEVIRIKNEEYRKAVKYSGRLWANKKTGSAYNEGLINSSKDRHKTERIGLLGETAVGKLLDLPVDFKYYEGGKPYDFFSKGSRLEVKTAARNYNALLIRARTETGKNIELAFDYCIAAFLSKELPAEEQADICIVGWIPREEIEAFEKKPARKRNHWNYDIPYPVLNPF